MTKKTKGNVFFISPIGQIDSPTRKRSDKVLEYIIKTVVENYGYKVFRGDQTSKPGEITDDIVQAIVNCSFAIADLSDQNPNVYYELATAHAANKPVVLLIEKNQVIPFDVRSMRVIHYGFDVEEVELCRLELEQQIQIIETQPETITNPILTSVNLQKLRESSIPQERQNAQVLTLLHKIYKTLNPSNDGYLTVHLKRTSDPKLDRTQLRKVHNMVVQFPGEAKFKIIVQQPSGKLVRMDFPEIGVNITPELLETLESMENVVKVDISNDNLPSSFSNLSLF